MNETLCPDYERLRAYTAGKLADDISEALADHIDSCSACQALLATFDEPEDTLVVYTEATAAESRMRLQTSEDQYLHGSRPEHLT